MTDITKRTLVWVVLIGFAVSAKTIYKRSSEDGADAEQLLQKDELLKDQLLTEAEGPSSQEQDKDAFKDEAAFNLPPPPQYDEQLNKIPEGAAPPPPPQGQPGPFPGHQQPGHHGPYRQFGPEFVPPPVMPLDICKGVDCSAKEGTVCDAVMPESCALDPQSCVPVPQCVPISEKEGECPNPVPLFMPQVPCGVPPNPQGCRRDLNCPSVMKCCPTDECLSVCAPPKGIVKMGTCPQKILVASGAAFDQFPNNQLVPCVEDRDCVARQKCCKVNPSDELVTAFQDLSGLDISKRAVCVNPVEIDQIEAQFHGARMAPPPPPGALPMPQLGMQFPPPGMPPMPPMPGMPGMQPEDLPGTVAEDATKVVKDVPSAAETGEEPHEL